MKTYCVFQLCDESGLNRLVDRICAKVQNGLDFYNKVYPNSEILFIPEIINEIPDAIRFYDPVKGISIEDLNWLRKHQSVHGMPIKHLIQRSCDYGQLGITRGMIIYSDGKEVSVHQSFLIELRHVYE